MVSTHASPTGTSVWRKTNKKFAGYWTNPAFNKHYNDTLINMCWSLNTVDSHMNLLFLPLFCCWASRSATWLSMLQLLDNRILRIGRMMMIREGKPKLLDTCLSGIASSPGIQSASVKRLLRFKIRHRRSSYSFMELTSLTTYPAERKSATSPLTSHTKPERLDCRTSPKGRRTCNKFPVNCLNSF